MKNRAPLMLKNLKENVPLLFKKLNLSFSETSVQRLNECIQARERFLNVVVKKRAKDFVLKIRLQDDKELARDLEREIKLFRFLKSNLYEKKFFFPRVANFGKFRNLQWYLREYQPGTLAGQMEKDHGFLKEFFDKISPKELAALIHSYQILNPKKIQNLHLHHHGGWWYKQDFDFYKKSFFKSFIPSSLNNNLFGESEIKEIEDLLKNKKRLLDLEAKYLCHGDLYPNNILVTPEKKITFLDWGISSLNNRSFDAAFIYLNAWRDEKWRDDFLKNYAAKQKEDDGFTELFRISLISLAVRFSGHCWRHMENKETAKADKKMLYSILKTHLKILKHALRDLNQTTKYAKSR